MAVKRFFLSETHASKDGNEHFYTVSEAVLCLKKTDDKLSYAPMLIGPRFETGPYASFNAASVKGSDDALAKARQSIPASDEMLHIRYLEHMEGNLNLDVSKIDEFRIQSHFAQSSYGEIIEVRSTAEALVAKRDINLPDIKEEDRLLCIRNGRGQYIGAMLLSDLEITWKAPKRDFDGDFDAWFPRLAKSVEAHERMVQNRPLEAAAGPSI